jgi:hypothetical protein
MTSILRIISVEQFVLLGPAGIMCSKTSSIDHINTSDFFVDSSLLSSVPLG